MRLRQALLSLVVVVAALPLLGASPAYAQLWLDAAVPGSAALGPAKALGAVIWSHGRSVDSEDSTAPTPPYMAILREGGWDAFRFNRLRASDTLNNSAHGLWTKCIG
jgi:hypothetical protein